MFACAGRDYRVPCCAELPCLPWNVLLPTCLPWNVLLPTLPTLKRTFAYLETYSLAEGFQYDGWTRSESWSGSGLKTLQEEVRQWFKKTHALELAVAKPPEDADGHK